uniref:Uncharacterized protein n=1 Tax=Candidatus Kentrum sp. FW TaxID=2126338 RepID=A0A450U226_9GAMM|nr:MAG: hypothetical protein BECKFW1821C_GA0114237_11109 [Candidatus Kentron sp. FW]
MRRLFFVFLVTFVDKNLLGSSGPGKKIMSTKITKGTKNTPISSFVFLVTFVDKSLLGSSGPGKKIMSTKSTKRHEKCADFFFRVFS